MSEVKIISDTHFNDFRMIAHLKRPFYCVEDMNDYIINSWNLAIKPDDICIHLGDIAIGISDKQLKKVVSKLNGIKVLIKGNWDKQVNYYYEQIGFHRVHDNPLDIDDYILSHEPLYSPRLICNPNVVNYHGHSHKHQYGRQHKNCSIDVMGYTPVKINIRKEDII